MIFCSCPKPGGCDTTFKAIYLGDVHSDQYIDRYEILPGSESAYKLNGTTFGSADDPLAGNIVDITVTNDLNRDGELEGTNFFGFYDTFKTSRPVEVPDRTSGEIKQVSSFKYDGISQYTATIMYTDGTSADTRLTVIQDDLGRTFVVPPEDGTGGDLIGATGSSERGPCGPFVVPDGWPLAWDLNPLLACPWVTSPKAQHLRHLGGRLQGRWHPGLAAQRLHRARLRQWRWTARRQSRAPSPAAPPDSTGPW